MFGTGLIVFRETLEAALFVGIIAAATRGVLNRSSWLALGIGVGAVGSLLMAAAIEPISNWADGIGQELVTMGILSIALAMLAWHCIWVSAHAKEMVADAKRIGTAVASGNGTLWAVALAVAMTVLREGAETVLFVVGLVSGSQEATGTLVAGGCIGLVLGAVIGWLIYAGLGKVKPLRLFAVTNVLILMLAGKLASQLAKTLSQADWVTWLADSAWDMSSLLPDQSLPAMLLHGVIGYEASPSQLQLVFYVGAILLIGLSARAMRLRLQQPVLLTPQPS